MSTWNSRQFNRIAWNGGTGTAALPFSPFTVDDQTFADTWEDDQTFALDTTGMTYTGAEMDSIVRGDDRRVIRSYTDLPTGHIVIKAWLTIKRKAADLDADALIQKSITTSSTSSGQITDGDSAGGTLEMHFDLSRTETGVATIKANKTYYYDVQVKLSDGQIHTLESGTVRFLPSYTDATS